MNHHTDHHVHACEVEPENMCMLIIIKMGNDGLPLRYEKQLLVLKGYMCRSELNKSTLLTIKMLQIKKSFRGKCGKKKKVRQKELNSGIHPQYLCSLKKDVNVSDGSKYISFAIENAKSIRNKVEKFMVHIIEDSIDLIFKCKTLLKDDDTDITSILESSGFKFHGHNRIDRTGGGLGILCRDAYKCTLKKQDSLISFAYSIWKIECDNSISFYVVGIY